MATVFQQTPSLVTTFDPASAGQADQFVQPAGVYVNGVLQPTVTIPLLSPSNRAFINTNSGTLALPTNPLFQDVYTSRAAVTTRTLPTPANSYTGQLALCVQESGHTFTIGVPTGVTVFMLSSTNTLTSKTATNWASGADGTSAQLVCTFTDGSTVATWVQVSGLGLWS